MRKHTYYHKLEHSPSLTAQKSVNTHGIAKPTLPHVTYQMLADDSFMATKMDEMVIGGSG